MLRGEVFPLSFLEMNKRVYSPYCHEQLCVTMMVARPRLKVLLLAAEKDAKSSEILLSS